MDPSEGYFMVLMMDHHRVTCTGQTHGNFLRPDQSWLLMRCSLHAQAVTEAVLRTSDADEKVAEGPTISAVRRDF